MGKTMLARDLEEQDIVVLQHGQRVKVTRIDRVPLTVWVYPIADGYVRIPGNEPVTLVHRPYRDGETQDTMRLAVLRHCKRVLAVEHHVGGTVDKAIAELHEVLDTYELGKE